MKSGTRHFLYLLTITALILGSFSCSPSKETPTTPATPTTYTESKDTQPVVLTVTLDDSASVSALIPQKGGSVSATLANGLVYTLDIPEGALLSDQEVSMTPIRSIDGLPFSGGLIGGVQLEPDGTLLMAPATLTIQIPNGYDKRYLVGFGYHGVGTGLHLASASGDGSTITLPIMSFSGHGAASGTDQEVNNQAGRSTGSAADDYQQQAADVVNGARARGELNDAEMQKLLSIYKDYYDKAVKPALQAATSDDNKIDAAIGMFLTWARQAQLLGLFEDMESRFNEGFALAIKGLKNAFDKAAQRCLSDQNINESTNMIKRLRELDLLGANDSSYTIEGKRKDFEKCLRYKVNLESIITATPSTNQQVVSHVAGTVILKLDWEKSMFLNVYKGNGDLKFKEYTSEWVGGSAGMNAVCMFTNLTTKDGKLRMAGRLGWSNLNSSEPKFNILLGVKPSGLEQGFPNLVCDTGMNMIQTNVNFNQSMWSGSFDRLHTDIKGNIAEMDENEMYFFSNFGSGGGKLIGRLTQSKTLTLPEGTIAEDLTIDIFEAPGAE